MIIYKVTNILNEKIYIGATKCSLRIRRRYHITCARNGKKKQYFHKALLKYGIENFIWEVIDTASDLNELKEKEKYWIKEYNSFSEKGYNRDKGGSGFHDFVRWPNKKYYQSGKHLSIETRKKISVAVSGKNNPMYKTNFYNIWVEKFGKEEADRKIIEFRKNQSRPNPMKGKKHSEQARQNIKQGCQNRDQNGEKNPFYGKKHTEATKQKMKDARKIINLDTNEIFDNIKQANIVYNLKSGIKDVCNGKSETAGGYRWMKYKDYLKINQDNTVPNPNKGEV